MSRAARRRGRPRWALALLAFLTSLDAIAGTAAGGPGEARPVRMPLDALEQARGSASAPVTVVEFTDYQCPFCRRFEGESWPALERNYIATGKVRFIVRDLPLKVHSAARPAAEAAHCAGEQGRFWPMHAALLARDLRLDDASVLGKAQALGLDVPRFRQCVLSNKYEAEIARNAAQANALGVRGTPTFIIGRVTHGELDGVRVAGAVPYADFAAYLDRLLAGR
ncbi:MAG: DsbA family protein [Gammaproteobacteria bacterium]|nr:DsbA family protein [Gammaproteobacteria bacterium]